MLAQASGKRFSLNDGFKNKLSLNQLNFFLQWEYLITLKFLIPWIGNNNQFFIQTQKTRCFSKVCHTSPLTISG